MITLRAPGPDPIMILPVPPSAAVESWYERELLHGVNQMNADIRREVLRVYASAPKPILPMTFPYGELGRVISSLEQKWEGTFNHSADELALRFVRMNLEHHDRAFAHSLNRAGVRLPKPVMQIPDGQITLDGDVAGHNFHGNQWTGGQGGSHEGSAGQRGELPGQHFREGSKFPTTVVGVHYSGQAGLSALDPNKYGTGNPGREYQRIMQMEPGPARDALLQRTYLYVAPNGETPKPEHILRDKSNAYEAKLTNVYDLAKDPEHLRDSAKNANELERSIIEHHYDGYMAPSPGEHGSMVLLGTPQVAVRPHYYTPAGAHDGDLPGHEFRGNQWTGGEGTQNWSGVPATLPKLDSPEVKQIIAEHTIPQLVNYDWDKVAFGVSSGEVVNVPLKDLRVQYEADMSNTRDIDLKKYFGGKELQSLPPIDASLHNGKLSIEDGHHRYALAKQLGVKVVPVTVELKDNPFKKLGYDIDDVIRARKATGAMDEFTEEAHPRDERGKFITGLGNKELPTRIVGGKDSVNDIEHDTHLSDYAALQAAVTVGGPKIETTTVTPEMKLAQLIGRTPGIKMPEPPATQAQMLRAFNMAVIDRAEKLKTTDADGKVTTVKGPDGKPIIVTPTMKLAQILGNAKFEVKAGDTQAKMLGRFTTAVVTKNEQIGGRLPTPMEKMAALVKDTPGLQLTGKESAKEICDKYIAHGVRNLLYLHDSMSQEDRDRAKQWYDGANKIANAFASQHGKTPEQIAACIAVLSPQKDWFQNVSLAERTMDIMRNHQDAHYDKAMSDWCRTAGAKGGFVNGYYTTARNPGVDAVLHNLEHGGKDGGPKTLAECKGIERAMFIRAYDETKNDKRYRELSPEGKRLGWAKLVDEDGDVQHDAAGNERIGACAWDGMSNIAKCADIYEDGRVSTISDRLGDEHKVRNFYNNIISPNSKNGHVTIDTHAVAAIQLMPLGGGALDVEKNFGAGFSNVASGLSGTYALNHEVYVRAAAERGLLPREMQSITWERVRSLYSAEFKRSDEDQTNKEGEVTRVGNHAARGIWGKVASGEIDEQTARARILEAATGGKGFSSPAWRGREGTDPIGSSTYQSKLAGAQLPVRSDSAPVSTRAGVADAQLHPAPRVQGRRLAIDSAESSYDDWSDFQVKFDVTPRLKRTIQQQLRDNIDLISTKRIKDGPAIPKKSFARLREMARESIERGRDLVGFTRDLEENFRITRRRASLIARDQNNKMTALFQRTRQLDCGITKAMWVHTAASLKPREEHEEFDRMTYSVEEGHDFDDGFGPVLPGEAINCGCLSMPIIPGFEE